MATGAIFENSWKLRASLFVTSRWPRSSGQTNYQVHHPPWPEVSLHFSQTTADFFIEHRKLSLPLRPWEIVTRSDCGSICPVMRAMIGTLYSSWGSNIFPRILFKLWLKVKLSRYWSPYTLVYWLGNEGIKELESAVTVTIGTAAKWQRAKLEFTYSLGFVFFLFPPDLLVRISI